MTLRISAENLKIGGIASQFCPHSKLNKKSQNVKKYFTTILITPSLWHIIMVRK